MGARDSTVYRSADHPSEVTVIDEFDSVEDARRFADSDALREAMQRSGVNSQPEIWIAEKA